MNADNWYGHSNLGKSFWNDKYIWQTPSGYLWTVEMFSLKAIGVPESIYWLNFYIWLFMAY